MTLSNRTILANNFLHPILPQMVGWLLGLLALCLFVALLFLQPLVVQGAVLSGQIDWVPTLGIALSWQFDGLSLLFALLISGIGGLIFIYASSYLAGDQQLGRFYLYLLLFMVSMLGLVLSGNLLTLFIFWELTSVTSYLLIGYKHSCLSSRKAALQALLVTGGGGLAFLAGILLLAQIGGTLEIRELITQSGAIQEHWLYLPIVLLVLAGAFTKSAQFPFHFWLPNAMAAPTPVSAYLHSATMVKAGVYLVARLTPVLGGTTLWMVLLTGCGAITMMVAAFLAWRQTDLKRILAYTTISALGMLMMLLGIGTAVALKAALVLLLAHALYKGALFMIAGVVEHQTGARDITRLGGLWRVMPVTALAAGMAGLSMSGLPPLTGFVGKELFYEATLMAPSMSWLLTGAALVANVLTVLAAGLIVLHSFGGASSTAAENVREAGVSLLLGPCILAGAGLWGGVMIGQVGTQWIAPALTTVTGAPASAKLSLWHGVNSMLLLSALTVGAAFLLWRGQARLLEAMGALDVGARVGPERFYDWLIGGMPRLAAWQTRWLQHGYLRLYLLLVVAVMITLVGFTLLSRAAPVWSISWSEIRLYEVGILALMLMAAIVATRAASRMKAIVAVGVVGLGMTLLFVFYSAPDLAMTQFAVEALTVLLFVFVIYRLPHFTRLTGRGERMRDGAVALLAGAVMAMLILTVIASPHPMHVSEYYAEQSWLAANGRNVVNVILVDFRALDTLGEIVVLIVAALGVHALIRPLIRDGK
ncbi:MAG: putative monovalent cation/H+ antiporter subunit A [Caldilineaceae bacterium]